MSVLIKGMEMPKSCHECPLLYVTSLCDGFKDCPLQPLVRCENCKYCNKEDEHEYWCYGFCSPARLVRKDDFCSHGSEKENAVYFCSHCRSKNEEMQEVANKDAFYGEALND